THRPAAAEFFLSSRRRHTRFSRDWSSDVCSSDLFAVADAGFLEIEFAEVKVVGIAAAEGSLVAEVVDCEHPLSSGQGASVLNSRSEERRVGKEWRARWGR